MEQNRLAKEECSCMQNCKICQRRWLFHRLNAEGSHYLPSKDSGDLLTPTTFCWAHAANKVTSVTSYKSNWIDFQKNIPITYRLAINWIRLHRSTLLIFLVIGILFHFPLLFCCFLSTSSNFPKRIPFYFVRGVRAESLRLKGTGGNLPVSFMWWMANGFVHRAPYFRLWGWLLILFVRF